MLPFLNEVEQLRLDLTHMANWLFGQWPEGLRPPEWNDRTVDEQPGTVRLSYFATTPEALKAARVALNAEAKPEAITGRTRRFTTPAGQPPVRKYVNAELNRTFGERVVVDVWTSEDVWLQTFPDEPLPGEDLCARDGHVRGPLVEHVAEGAALLCERCGTECVWSGDTVTEVVR